MKNFIFYAVVLRRYALKGQEQFSNKVLKAEIKLDAQIRFKIQIISHLDNLSRANIKQQLTSNNKINNF